MEAIATRLEAIASRLEAIAIRFGGHLPMVFLESNQKSCYMNSSWISSAQYPTRKPTQERVDHDRLSLQRVQVRPEPRLEDGKMYLFVGHGEVRLTIPMSKSWFH